MYCYFPVATGPLINCDTPCWVQCLLNDLRIGSRSSLKFLQITLMTDSKAYGPVTILKMSVNETHYSKYIYLKMRTEYYSIDLLKPMLPQNGCKPS